MSTESITGAELRAAIDRLGWYVQHEPGIPSSTHPADRIIRDVERHREPGSLPVPPDEYPAFRAAVADAGIPASGDSGQDPPSAPEQARDRTGADQGDAPEEPHAALIEAAWGLIANAGWDAFSGQADLPKSPGWHEAALRWRDDYHRWLDLHHRPGGWQSWEELATSLCRERDALFADNERLKRALRDAANGEPLVMPQDEFGLVKWLQDTLAEAIGPACGLAAVGRALEAVTPVVEHAARAAAGSHEGIRLWMLDCNALAAKYWDRVQQAEAKLAAIAEHRNAACAALRIAETQARYPAGDEATAERYRAAREALEGAGGEEGDRG